MRMPKISLAVSSVVLLIAVLLMSVYAMNAQIGRNRALVVERAQTNASVLAEFAMAAHQQYSDTVTGLAWAAPEGTSQGAGYTETLAPFPEKFARSMAQRFSAKFPEITFKLYSGTPSNPNRYRRLDRFAEAAIGALANRPGGAYEATELLPDGRLKVRHASAVVMHLSCIQCHNAPQTHAPRRLWGVGDVRGVREVSIILPKSATDVPTGLRGLLILMFVSSGLGVFVIYPAVSREVARRAYFNSLSKSMNAKVQTYRTQAFTDALSSLPNRRAFERALTTLTETEGARQDGLGLILLDIDHFKSVNDAYGHDIGDVVIRSVAQDLRASVRPGDIVARVGGEEFGAVLKGGDMQVFLDIAERLRSVVAVRNYTASGREFSVTISAGVALHSAGVSGTELYRRADSQLYRAKSGGRDRVSH